MTQRQSHAGEQHPEEWRRDLNPDPQAGQNRGGESAGAGPQARSAYELKAAQRRLSHMSDDDLRRIPIVPVGRRLEQGAVYIDLHTHDCREFKARGDMEAGPDNWYVPKSEVDYQLWNQLIGVDDPERLGQADEA